MRADYPFNIFDPAVKADPYRHYREMRSIGRVVHNPFLFGTPMLHRYEDVLAVVRDHATFSSARAPDQEQRVKVVDSPTMLGSDPPDHTRLRGTVARAFTPRSIARMEPHIAALAREMLAPLADGEDFDVPSRLSSPLPVTVIAEMLGVALEDRDDFARWSHDIIAALNPLAASDEVERAQAAAEALVAYFREEVARRRARPADDLVGRLVVAAADGTVTDDELLASCVLLLLGGNETTTNLITNGALALARHPEQRERVLAEPELLTGAVEECLRFDAPVQATARLATRDVELGGETIGAGTMVVALLGAANHDPSQFPDSDRFDVARSPNAHLSFGHGIHFCLGATLARLEARVALQELLLVAPRYGLASGTAALEYGLSFFFHSPVRLPITASA